MTGKQRVVPTYPRPPLLGIYLNDHLAGSAAGVALAKRIAKSHLGTDAEESLRRLAREVAQDRETLVMVMRNLGLARTRYKEGLARAAEWVGRLKPNGSVRKRSPLSSVVELETMSLGVTGKLAGWRTLRLLSESEPRLDAGQLDELVAGAERQVAELERLRLRAVTEGLARREA